MGTEGRTTRERTMITFGRDFESAERIKSVFAHPREKKIGTMEEKIGRGRGNLDMSRLATLAKNLVGEVIVHFVPPLW